MKKRNDYPNPLEFSAGFLVMVSPAIVIATMIIIFTGCGTTEPTYVSSNSNRFMSYENKKGELIEVPLNNNECVGYKYPYHITQYNK